MQRANAQEKRVTCNGTVERRRGGGEKERQKADWGLDLI